MLKLERCGAGILTVCINQNGDVFPCAALCSKVKSFGNVQEKPLKEVLDLMKNYMEEAFSVDKDEKCKICDFKYFCGGGCRANNDLTVRDPLCDTLKARYTQLLNNLMATSTKTEKKLYY
jgi:radical SAM protein with 4Fe4S-binding SPASM domain